MKKVLLALICSIFVLLASCAPEYVPQTPFEDYEKLVGIWYGGPSPSPNYEMIFYPRTSNSDYQNYERAGGTVIINGESFEYFPPYDYLGTYNMTIKNVETGNSYYLKDFKITDDYTLSFSGLFSEEYVWTMNKTSSAPDNGIYSNSNPKFSFTVDWTTNTALITGITVSSTGYLEIPESYNGYPVVGFSEQFSWSSTTYDSVTSLFIPSSFTGEAYYNRFPSLYSVTVDENNPRYYCVNGVVYDKSGTSLSIDFTPDNGRDLIIEEGVESVYGGLNSYNTRNRIYIPSTVTYLASSNPNCKIIECAEDNPEYVSYKGVLYYRESGEVAAMPSAYEGRLEIREGATKLERTGKATSVYLPSTITTVYYSNNEGHVESYEVSADNPNLKSENGVIYTKDGTRLVTYPSANKETSFTVPNGVKLIEYKSIVSENLTTLRISDTVEWIETQAIELTNPNSTVYIPSSVQYVDYWGVQANTANCEAQIPPSAWDYSWNILCKNTNWGVSM